MQSLTATSQNNQNDTQKQDNHSHKRRPDRSAIRGMAPRAIAINAILYNRKTSEINSHDDQRDDPSERGHEGCEEGADYACAESEKEGNEGEDACNWVQHERMG